MEDFQQGADHSSRPIRSAALRGYVPDKCLAALIKAASVQDLRRSLVAIGGDHLMILLAGTLSYLLWRDVAWWAAALAAPVTLTIAGRAMRGLECLVHEASHYNLTRRRRLNDAIANVLCAWSVLSEVQQYRTSHMIHHRSFGHADDPDRVRNLRLMLEDFDRSSLAALTVGAVRRIVPYVPGWWGRHRRRCSGYSLGGCRCSLPCPSSDSSPKPRSTITFRTMRMRRSSPARGAISERSIGSSSTRTMTAITPSIIFTRRYHTISCIGCTACLPSATRPSPPMR